MSRHLADRARRLALTAFSVLALATNARAGESERSEIEFLKQQIEELKRSDAQKQRQLDEMMQILRQLQPAAVAAGPARSGRKTPPAVAAAAPSVTPPEPSIASPGRSRTLPAPSVAIPAPEVSAASDRTATVAAPKSALDAALDESETPTGATAPGAPVGGGLPTDTTVGHLEIPERGPAPPTWLARPVPGATLRLLEPSMDVLTVVGGSSVPDEYIEKLEGGEHDPKRRGFTLQQAELSLYGAVDPYFSGETHFVFTEDGVETEEAFATTTSLPWNLQVRAGYFLTAFGRINPTHPHSWPWVDQPVVATRMFGGDGLRSAGAQVNYLLPLPFYSEFVLGAQNANNGGLTKSFFVPVGETTVGGRPSVNDSVANMEDILYLARSASSFNVGDDFSGLVGFSGLFGPNSTGGDSRTYLYGADLTFKWRPANNFRGWPFVLWQSEVMMRDFAAAAYVAPVSDDPDEESSIALSASPGGLEHISHGDDGSDESDGDENLPAATLRDWGFYTQLLYGFHYRWAAGLRYEFANSSGQSVGGTPSDYLRDARHRVSPLLVFNPTEFSRLRLQYNYDNAQFLPENQANSIWMSLEVLFGTHPAHQY